MSVVCYLIYSLIYLLQLTKENMLQILRQNPCLEEIALNIRSYNQDPEYKAELMKEAKTTNPRISKIDILVRKL